MALWFFKSSVKSCEVISRKSKSKTFFELSLFFNSNEFIHGCGVITAFDNNKLTLPPDTNRKNALDASKVSIFDPNTKFKVSGKDAAQVFLPILKPGSEVVVCFDDSSFEICGVEMAQ